MIPGYIVAECVNNKATFYVNQNRIINFFQEDCNAVIIVCTHDVIIRTRNSLENIKAQLRGEL